MVIDFTPFTGSVEELPTDYNIFLGKFLYEQTKVEYHVIIRLNEDLYQIGDTFHYDKDFLKLIGYKGIE